MMHIATISPPVVAMGIGMHTPTHSTAHTCYLCGNCVNADNSRIAWCSLRVNAVRICGECDQCLGTTGVCINTTITTHDRITPSMRIDKMCAKCGCVCDRSRRTCAFTFNKAKYGTMYGGMLLCEMCAFYQRIHLAGSIAGVRFTMGETTGLCKTTQDYVIATHRVVEKHHTHLLTNSPRQCVCCYELTHRVVEICAYKNNTNTTTAGVCEKCLSAHNQVCVYARLDKHKHFDKSNSDNNCCWVCGCADTDRYTTTHTSSLLQEFRVCNACFEWLPGYVDMAVVLYQ